MLYLSLLWLLMGAFIGLIASAARVRRASWTGGERLVMIGTGAVIACSGGWVGMLFLGRYFATATALWIAVAGTIIFSFTHFCYNYKSTT